MKTLILILLITIFSYAISIPNRVYTSVVSVNGDRITLSEPLSKGMSALVVRSTSSGEYALVFIEYAFKNSAVIIDKDPVGTENLAKLKPIPKVGDRVIGGFNYDKALVLAPKNSYNQIVSQLSVKVIDPDIYNSYLASKGSSSYRDFAKLVGIGIVIVSKGNTIEIIDAISGKVLSREEIK